MSKADRSELKSLLMRRFKSLKGDVAVRVTELKAEAERALDDSYSEENRLVRELISELVGRMARAKQEAERILLDASVECQLVFDQFAQANPDIQVSLRRDRAGMVLPSIPVEHAQEPRKDALRALFAELDAASAAAKQRLDVEEVEMRTVLAVETLETEEAKRFLDRIPTVGELVPATRLAALGSDTGGSSL
jgi:dephospho-CoA kinase